MLHEIDEILHHDLQNVKKYFQYLNAQIYCKTTL